MSKFRVGDEVIRTKNVSGDLPAGTECIVDGCDNHLLSIVGYEGLFCEDNFKLAQSKYPNPPHVHADVIIEWAKGADIVWQRDYEKGTNVWRDKQSPSWHVENIYKVKPTQSELADIKTQSKIYKLLAKIDKLKLSLSNGSE